MTTTLKYLKYPTSILLLFAALLTGCMRSDYSKLVKEELAKGIRNDSLMLGFEFGDTRNEFYGKCYDLNKKGIISDGGGGLLQYRITDSLFHKQPTVVRLLMQPTFDANDSIAELKVEFAYPGWSPGNRELQSDSLLKKTKKFLMLWYKGNEFVIANVNDTTHIPVKVDGNRRVTVEVIDSQTVGVKIQDILHPMFQHSISRKD